MDLVGWSEELREAQGLFWLRFVVLIRWLDFCVYLFYNIKGRTRILEKSCRCTMVMPVFAL